MGFRDSLKGLFVKPSTESDDVDLDEVQKLIGYHFRDESRLLLSLTHRSFSHATGSDHPANERLEFLGDSVLGMVVSHLLFDDHPKCREGELTRIKALLVNEITLAAMGRKIGLNKYVRLSHDEDRSGGRVRPSIVSDTFEAVIAAVYLDGGFDAARDVILRLIYANKDSITADSNQRNYKGELLELVQASGEGMPRYDTVHEEGPDHDKMFDVEVYVGDVKIGSGRGNSKKEAEQKAAAEALNHNRRDA